MPAPKYDPDNSRGVRAPGPIPTRSAWTDIKRVRDAGVRLEKLLQTLLPDGSEKEHILTNIDSLLCHAEAVIHRNDRVGIPEDQSELRDIEATLRLATSYPEQFKAFDVSGLRKRAELLRKAPVAQAR